MSALEAPPFPFENSRVSIKPVCNLDCHFWFQPLSVPLAFLCAGNHAPGRGVVPEDPGRVDKQSLAETMAEASKKQVSGSARVEPKDIRLDEGLDIP